MEKAARRATRRKMHQTTVRFGEDLWISLEQEARRLGVSIAHYVRDAALRRLSYEAGRRHELQASEEPGKLPGLDVEALGAQERARSELSQSNAVWAQGRLARERAAELRSRSEDMRADRVRLKT
jgi:hypothetical protein